MSIEEHIHRKSTISEALEAMSDYKCWSNSTLSSYRIDVMHFEHFLNDMEMDGFLENGRLHFVQKWIKYQRDEGVSNSTIRRRIASLSSIYSFYRNLGVVQQNCFKAVGFPVGNQDHHSPILELGQLKEVYHYAENLPKEEYYIRPTIKMLIFTGLRNEALTNLKVKQINFEKSLLYLDYDTAKINTKHKVQLIPIPPKLLNELQDHIRTQHLAPNDKLLFGLSGQPLGSKALNRLANRISLDLGWSNDQRVTPHGFRATISTVLSERGVELAAIKFLLGHSEQDNLQFYIRRYGRHIRLLHRELARIEEEFSQKSTVFNDFPIPNITRDIEYKKTPEITHKLPKELLLKLLDTDPGLAVIVIQKGLAHV
ncbi:tyrosine-type recombinase/integrase [Brevibacillus centrosporus]|uniref:Site-specific recombinase XerD n=1 Tax=Brevibacillus centrosporus TaxID=54910 RepID=A0A1I4DDP0_9BACL|nr:site-specific integrase [Brevibacillus centrosporus]SFK90890.1 Site-specific recombinase XerD [Brevibacillus centrosporus]